MTLICKVNNIDGLLETMYAKNMQTLLEAVRGYKPVFENKTLLIACSGGADSMALLHALVEIGVKSIHVAHVNHGLRGKASDEDQRFVRSITEEYGLFFHGRQVKVSNTASIEMAAREARYKALTEIYQLIEADYLLLAHHLDDHIETFFLRALRGASLEGLASISLVAKHHNMRLLRPFLSVRKEDIETYLQTRSYSWREDASNHDPSIPRNVVRHQVLPVLEDVYGREIHSRINYTLQQLSREEDFIASTVDKTRAEISDVDVFGVPFVFIDKLQQLHPVIAERVIKKVAYEQGILMHNRAAAHIIAQLKDSCDIQFSEEYTAHGAHNRLYLLPHEYKDYDYALTPNGVLEIPEAGLILSSEISPVNQEPNRAAFGEFPVTACLQITKAEETRVRVRNWKAGDRTQPSGLDGHKKIQDIFSDAKLPPHWKKRIPLVCIGEEIAWLPGYRIAEGREPVSPGGRLLKLVFNRYDKM